MFFAFCQISPMLMAMSGSPWGFGYPRRELETGTLTGISLFRPQSKEAMQSLSGSCLPSEWPSQGLSAGLAWLDLCFPGEVTELLSKGTVLWEQKEQEGLVSSENPSLPSFWVSV